MLTENQEGYLKTIPDDRVAHVVPFDPAVQVNAHRIISEIEKALPSAKVFYLGSSRLSIAGENDIDLAVLGGDKFDDYFSILKELYGEPLQINLKDAIINWEFVRDKFPVELHLMKRIIPDFQEQLDTQKIFENNPELLKEYEQIKIRSNGLPWKEYTKRKYEFWNKILGIN